MHRLNPSSLPLSRRILCTSLLSSPSHRMAHAMKVPFGYLADHVRRFSLLTSSSSSSSSSSNPFSAFTLDLTKLKDESASSKPWITREYGLDMEANSLIGLREWDEVCNLSTRNMHTFGDASNRAFSTAHGTGTAPTPSPKNDAQYNPPENPGEKGTCSIKADAEPITTTNNKSQPQQQKKQQAQGWSSGSGSSGSSMDSSSPQAASSVPSYGSNPVDGQQQNMKANSGSKQQQQQSSTTKKQPSAPQNNQQQQQQGGGASGGMKHSSPTKSARDVNQQGDTQDYKHSAAVSESEAMDKWKSGAAGNPNLTNRIPQDIDGAAG